VLQELDEKLDGGEDLRVGSEVVGVRRAIDDGVRASLVDEQVLEGDRGPDASRMAAPCCRPRDVLSERLACFRGASVKLYRGVHREAAVCPVEHILGEPLVQELALQEERDDPLAEAGAHLRQIDLWDVDESGLAVKASLQEQAVPMGIPSAKRS
jgi:hypothetical protein